ncbi:hypothetical protein HELRODRAFT_182018 [Helobdella robusta]|uniref:Uncharacterized protein n=1 Tax=Helobdella robusta TaxID=6412 RepID=T1FHL7_HELRO|nr:hypothetical protein HELRODRAFT_182018 [Helobdella robusta]ESN91843.1 hypothetical protein HELRODRAFT_182018 [Helobdella robusta]
MARRISFIGHLNAEWDIPCLSLEDMVTTCEQNPRRLSYFDFPILEDDHFNLDCLNEKPNISINCIPETSGNDLQAEELMVDDDNKNNSPSHKQRKFLYLSYENEINNIVFNSSDLNWSINDIKKELMSWTVWKVCKLFVQQLMEENNEDISGHQKRFRFGSTSEDDDYNDLQNFNFSNS